MMIHQSLLWMAACILLTPSRHIWLVSAFSTIPHYRPQTSFLHPRRRSLQPKRVSVLHSSYTAGHNHNHTCHEDVPVSSQPSSTVTANDLRRISVTNANGQRVMLGELMAASSTSDATIVVFLRHLGCFHCWSYAREWNLLQEEIRAANQQLSSNNSNTIVGPIFVSIGDEDRLTAFLEKHPEISPSQMAVDGYDFAAYKQAGFGRFDEKPESVTQDAVPRPIELGGWKGWWTFLTSFMPLAPVTPDMEFPEMLTPEGLFWVGGTMVVQGDEIVYRWDDRVSGDHPNASKVLAIAKEAAAVATPKS